MADESSSPSIDRDRLANAPGPPGLLHSYAGRYQPKTPDSGVSRFAYRTPYSNTAFNPGSMYTAYNSPGAQQNVPPPPQPER